ncbi:MAG: RagB/SusD family nutrient uptake outer membrane protein, partial [Bacteroidota bacterium]|nr:RagB/SusD family nutrient uptake outer membrane protein [Bacteroidota bacterium]
ELLYERRYSLYYEGHRWIDMRRYGLLGQLPIDRPGDDVWSEFPLPVSEQP